MNLNEQTFPATDDDFCVVCGQPAAFTVIDGDAFCSRLCQSVLAEHVADMQAWQVALGYAEE